MLLTRITVRNFKCFRAPTTVEFGQSTYLVGPNNSGKTALIAALHCFFDSNRFSPDLINKGELAAKKEGFNRSDITVEFDLTKVTGKTRQRRMIARWGDRICITKSFTWRAASETVQIEFALGGDAVAQDELERDISEMLAAVSISYIHPQEGTALLQKAQEKFKQRLFHNWGRHASVAERVKDVQETWEKLRQTASSYLSSALTSRLRDIWPSAEVRVDLPERIQDVVAVSDITFRSSPTLPQVTLPAHGTGAQSAILYQTHYLLDTDKTLHPGQYYPIWLLEEPESFLHADIAAQLAKLLSSSEWLSSIQMVISTHSAIILAASRASANLASWVVCESHAVKWQRSVEQVDESDIRDVALLMGDANFGVYFDASARAPQVFFEDSRPETRQKYLDLGIPAKPGVSGISDIKRHLHVLLTLGGSLAGDVYFVVDSDKGLEEIAPILSKATAPTEEMNGWMKWKVARGVYVVHPPSGLASEDLFEEWVDIIQESFDDIYESDLTIRSATPSTLSRVVSELRKRTFANSDEAKMVLKRHQDVKDRFWCRASIFSFRHDHKQAIERLLPRDSVA